MQQEKYDAFLRIYTNCIEKHIPLNKCKTKEIQKSFNAKCDMTKTKRDQTWKKLKRNRTQTEMII